MLLITGGTGFIGKYFVAKMIQQGYDIRLLVRGDGNAKNLPSGVEIFKGDATKLESLSGISKDVDIVVHMVGAISLNPEQNFLANNSSTKNIVESCKNVEKIVYTSSADVFGPIEGVADENYTCKPNNAYGTSKIQAERTLLESGIPSIIFRPTIVYGIGSPWWSYGMGWLGWGFIPETENLTQVVHVEDVCNALSIGVKKGNGTYIIADEKPVKIVDLFSKTVRLLGKKPKRLPISIVRFATMLIRKKPYFEVAMANRAFSIEKAKKELKWYPKCDFDSNFRTMVEWYKKLNKM